jgi:predicted cobalt transporter CbtA
MPNVFQINFVVIDIAISAVMYGVAGAAMGWALDRFK